MSPSTLVLIPFRSGLLYYPNSTMKCASFKTS